MAASPSTTVPSTATLPFDGSYIDSITDVSLYVGGTLFADTTGLTGSEFRVRNVGSFAVLQFDLDFDSVLAPAIPIDFGNLTLNVSFEEPWDDDSIPTAEDVNSRTFKGSKLSALFQASPLVPKFVAGGSSLSFGAGLTGFRARPDLTNPIPEPTGALLFAGGLLLASRAVRSRRNA